MERGQDIFSRIEAFVLAYPKQVAMIVGGILVIIIGFLAYKNFYVKPMNEHAQKQVWRAIQYFQMDSFNLALNGDGLYPGFLQIIDRYGGTSTANTASYYAGISYLNLGMHDQAIKHLKDCDFDDPFFETIRLKAMGDAYAEKGNYKKALKWYAKAVNKNRNDLTTPELYRLAGLMNERLGNLEDALIFYTKLREEYGNTVEGLYAEKYIGRVKAALKREKI
ncbi:MAG: tetratricopeptide repeat protein [Chlorobi bacterium]|nr:tetratricopeptide repeat protein [Chlorobiota bacterium]